MKRVIDTYIHIFILMVFKVIGQISFLFYSILCSNINVIVILVLLVS